MNGVSEEKFAPDETMTRAMLVTVLWRRADSPKPTATNPFTDVPEGKWYTDAVIWAASEGVVNGVAKGRFDPDGNITREQMATVLYRYSSGKGEDVSATADLSVYPDAARVSGWARTALAWANGSGIINGSSENGSRYLQPNGNATRAQVAAILMRYIEK